MYRLISAVAVSLALGFLLGQQFAKPVPQSHSGPVQVAARSDAPAKTQLTVLECSGDTDDSKIVEAADTSVVATESAIATPTTDSAAAENDADYPQVANGPSLSQELLASTIRFAAGQLPQDTVLSLLEAAVPYKKHELASMNDPVTFAGKVAQLATGEDLGFGNSEIAPNSSVTTFMFDENYEPGVDQNVVNPKTTRIFSHFDLPGYERSDVLVKWYYADSNEVLSFKRQPINPEHPRHYVWLENNLGWVGGNYVVEIYSTDESVAQLSRGNFYVSR